MPLSIPQELIEQMKKGNVILFCGAGISMSKGGLPSGEQLARELAKRVERPEMANGPLPEVAQAYELKMGHQSLIEYISDRIDDPSYVPLRTHQLIAALSFTKIVTTNWDNLLEKAMDQASKPVVKVVQDSDVNYANEAKVLLVKLHGSIEQKNSIIITGDDYYDVFARLPETANLVQTYFTTKTVLFLGFGLADQDCKRLYYEVVRHVGVHKRRAYAVQLNPDEFTVQYWEQKNVQIIAADATVFLEALADALGKDIVPSPKPTPTIARQTRRVDAALPSQAQVDQSIDLVIAVKLPESPMLDAGEIRKAKISRKFPDDANVEAKPAEVEFPIDESTKRPGPAILEIQVLAPNFEVDGPKRKSLLVPPDRDSELCKFPLTPRTHGDLEVTVELYNSQGAHIGTMSLETEVLPSSVPIDRRAAIIRTVAILPLVFVIAPSGGMTFTIAKKKEYVELPPPRAHRPRSSVNLKMVEAILGVILVFIAVSVWLVPNAMPLLSWTPTIVSSPTRTSIPSTIATPTSTPFPPSATPTFTPAAPTPTKTPKPATPTATPVVPTPTPHLTVMGKIAYVMRDGIYVMNADGSNRRRVYEGGGVRMAVLSPDGNKIAFARQDGLWVMDVNGNGVQQIVTESTKYPYPAWAPDSNQIVYVDRSGEYIVSLPDGVPQFLDRGWDSESYPAWSPDGGWFAYQSHQGLVKQPVSGGPITFVLDSSTNWGECRPAWSPDGMRIAYSKGHDIFVVNADGSGQTKLTDHPGDDWDPRWSPDGSKIVFTTDRDGNYEIYVMNPDGSNQMNLTNSAENEERPTWAP